jgi:hypothetical protein
MSYVNLNNPANFQLQEFEQLGFRYIVSGRPTIGGETYRTIFVLTDAVVTATCPNGDSLSSETLVAGTVIHGFFEDVSVASGSLLAYKAGPITAQEIFDAYKAYVYAQGGIVEGESCAVADIAALLEDKLYSAASLVLIPSGYKVSHLYAERPLDSNGDLTFTRASNATRVGPDGLIEKGRENLLLQSNQFNTTWGNITTTEVGGQSGYDGTNDAWRINLNAGTTLKAVNQNFSAYSGVSTASFYAKAGTHSIVQFGTASQNNVFVAFDLSNGSVGPLSSLAIDASMTSVGGGWYRIQVAFEAAGTAGFVIAAVDSLSATRFPSTSSTGDFYIQDAQLEQGLVATDYIETTTTTAQAGILEDMPRLDYSGGASCPSLLLEPQRTNILTHSEYFGASYWTKDTGTTLTTNAAISPDGSQNATRFESPLSSKGLFTYGAVNNQTISIYIKAGNTDNIGKSVNLFTTTISQSFVLTNEWQRISVSGSASNLFALYPSSVDGINAFIWGGQAEAASYPTSYIPTYGTSATRTADACSKTGISSLIGQTEGVLYWEGENIGDDFAPYLGLFADAPNTNNTRVMIYYISKTSLQVQVRLNGVQQFLSAAASVSGKAKVAIGYKQNDFVLYVDGVKISESSSGSTFTNELTTFDFNIAACKSDKILLFPTRLTNAQLAELTTL